MKSFFYLLVAFSVLSSCAGGLYSHYPKMAKEKKMARKVDVEVINETSIKEVIGIHSLPQKQASLPVQILPEPVQILPEINKCIAKLPNKQKFKINNNNKIHNDSISVYPENQVLNTNIEISIGLGVAGVIMLLYSILFPVLIFVALALEIVAIVFSFIAAFQVFGEPGKYSNENQWGTSLGLSLAMIITILSIMAMFLLFSVFFVGLV